MAFLIERPVPDRPYFKVGEVAHILGVVPSTVRYWQKEFPDHIHPEQSMSGQNVFSRNDVIVMAVILNLVRIEGISLKDARIALGRIIRENGGKVENIKLCQQFDLGLDEGSATPPISEQPGEPSGYGDSPECGSSAETAGNEVESPPADDRMNALEIEIAALREENASIGERMVQAGYEAALARQEAFETAARLRILQEHITAISASILESLDCKSD